MSGIVYRVPPLKILDVRRNADKLRSMMGLQDAPSFPVMTVLEKVLDEKLGVLRLEVWEDRALAGAEGLTFKDDEGVDRIVLPESVYRAAWNDDGRSRFTAAHEIGHWVLHSRCALTRVREENLRGAFENSEWQANLFAAELLMPVSFIYREDNAQQLADRFGVSLQAAQNRVTSLSKWGINLKRKPPHDGGGL